MGCQPTAWSYFVNLRCYTTQQTCGAAQLRGPTGWTTCGANIIATQWLYYLVIHHNVITQPLNKVIMLYCGFAASKTTEGLIAKDGAKNIYVSFQDVESASDCACLMCLTSTTPCTHAFLDARKSAICSVKPGIGLPAHVQRCNVWRHAIIPSPG